MNDDMQVVIELYKKFDRYKDNTYEELARVLTQVRGGEAEKALDALAEISAKSPANERLARALANRIGLTTGLGAYQSAAQSARGMQ